MGICDPVVDWVMKHEEKILIFLIIAVIFLTYIAIHQGIDDDEELVVIEEVVQEQIQEKEFGTEGIDFCKKLGMVFDRIGNTEEGNTVIWCVKISRINKGQDVLLHTPRGYVLQ